MMHSDTISPTNHPVWLRFIDHLKKDCCGSVAFEQIINANVEYRKSVIDAFAKKFKISNPLHVALVDSTWVSLQEQRQVQQQQQQQQQHHHQYRQQHEFRQVDRTVDDAVGLVSSSSPSPALSSQRRTPPSCSYRPLHHHYQQHPDDQQQQFCFYDSLSPAPFAPSVGSEQYQQCNRASLGAQSSQPSPSPPPPPPPASIEAHQQFVEAYKRELRKTLEVMNAIPSSSPSSSSSSSCCWCSKQALKRAIAFLEQNRDPPWKWETVCGPRCTLEELLARTTCRVETADYKLDSFLNLLSHLRVMVSSDTVPTRGLVVVAPSSASSSHPKSKHDRESQNKKKRCVELLDTYRNIVFVTLTRMSDGEAKVQWSPRGAIAAAVDYLEKKMKLPLKLFAGGKSLEAIFRSTATAKSNDNADNNDDSEKMYRVSSFLKQLCPPDVLPSARIIARIEVAAKELLGSSSEEDDDDDEEEAEEEEEEEEEEEAPAEEEEEEEEEPVTSVAVDADRYSKALREALSSASGASGGRSSSYTPSELQHAVDTLAYRFGDGWSWEEIGVGKKKTGYTVEDVIKRSQTTEDGRRVKLSSFLKELFR